MPPDAALGPRFQGPKAFGEERISLWELVDL